MDRAAVILRRCKANYKRHKANYPEFARYQIPGSLLYAAPFSPNGTLPGCCYIHSVVTGQPLDRLADVFYNDAGFFSSSLSRHSGNQLLRVVGANRFHRTHVNIVVHRCIVIGVEHAEIYAGFGEFLHGTLTSALLHELC